MFFLITNITVGKRYPRITTQFIIGCIMYAASFFVITNIINGDLFEQYKYYIFALIIVDALFLVYLAKISNPANEKAKEKENDVVIENDTTENNATHSNSLYSPTTLSETNDIHVTHDTSSSDPDKYDLFLISDKESKEVTEEKSEKSEASSLSVPSVSIEKK